MIDDKKTIGWTRPFCSSYLCPGAVDSPVPELTSNKREEMSTKRDINPYLVGQTLKDYEVFYQIDNMMIGICPL